jgi:hypothetical protein
MRMKGRGGKSIREGVWVLCCYAWEHSQDQVEISIDIRHDLITAPSTTLCVAKPDGVAGAPIPASVTREKHRALHQKSIACF